MYTLYYSPGACSKAVHVALQETGARYEAVCCDLHGSSKDQNLLSVNSRHQVPVLVDGDFAVREGAAILIYLLDKERSPLLPQSGQARASALEWLCWANASLHPLYGNVFGVSRLTPDAKVQESLLSHWQKRIQGMWDDVETHLSTSTFLAGEHISMGDILMTVISDWQPQSLKTPFKFGHNTQRVIDAVKNRPSWQQVSDSEAQAKAQRAA